jgi:putative phosphoesterase
MRLAALYDIHGNMPALEAVLTEIRSEGVDEIVVGGDVVPGPMPREVIEALRALDVPVRYIKGNCEVAVLAARAGEPMSPNLPEQAREAMRWTAGVIDDADARWFASWPMTLRLEILGIGSTLFCHGTPQSEVEIFLRTTPEEKLRSRFDDLGVALVVCGHTHMQFDRMIGATRVVNAGSIGMPFGEPGAYWLLLDSGVSLRRTAYDLEAAADEIRHSGYLQAEDFATRTVQPPSEAEILAAYARVEIK